MQKKTGKKLRLKCFNCFPIIAEKVALSDPVETCTLGSCKGSKFFLRFNGTNGDLDAKDIFHVKSNRENNYLKYTLYKCEFCR